MIRKINQYNKFAYFLYSRKSEGNICDINYENEKNIRSKLPYQDETNEDRKNFNLKKTTRSRNNKTTTSIMMQPATTENIGNLRFAGYLTFYIGTVFDFFVSTYM